MARSLVKAKLLVSSVTDGLSLSISRRGYAAAPLGSVSARGGTRTSIMEKNDLRTVMKEDSVGASSAWGPDPITGYYRPDNRAVEIDPAELREMLLNHHKVRAH